MLRSQRQCRLGAYGWYREINIMPNRSRRFTRGSALRAKSQLGPPDQGRGFTDSWPAFSADCLSCDRASFYLTWGFGFWDCPYCEFLHRCQHNWRKPRRRIGHLARRWWISGWFSRTWFFVYGFDFKRVAGCRSCLVIYDHGLNSALHPIGKTTHFFRLISGDQAMFRGKKVVLGTLGLAKSSLR